MPEQRLVHAIVPFWFLKMKGPAVQYALRDTGVDLKRLGVTPGDLEQYGAGVVLDEARANGDRLRRLRDAELKQLHDHQTIWRRDLERLRS